MTEKLEKDAAGTITAARDLATKLVSQAHDDGGIDEADLEQLVAVLKVAGDEESTSSTSTSSSSDKPTEADTTNEGEPNEGEPTSESNDDDLEEDETSSIKKVKKGNGPVSYRPTPPNMIFDQQDALEAQLPQFIAAMTKGSVREAQRIAGDSSIAFDTMMNMAQHAILSKGGWFVKNLSKINSESPDPYDPQQMRKALTSSNLSGINLIRLAKLMLPVSAPLTARLPMGNPNLGSDFATWKAQLGWGGMDDSGFYGIAEADTGVTPPNNFLTFNAPYKEISANDAVTLKAIHTNRGYSDPLQIAVIRAMSAVLRGNEKTLLNNNNGALSAPSGVTGAPSATGTIVAGAYYVGVTALTGKGSEAHSIGGASAKGETTATFTATAVTLSATGGIALTWNHVDGAVAYNIYVGTDAGATTTCVYHSTVTVNSINIAALATGTTKPPTSDTTADTDAFEGLVAWAEKSTIYGNTITGKIPVYDAAGAGLTTGNGGIVEFDNVLEQAYRLWATAPSCIVMSAKMNAQLVGKLLALGGNGGFYRLEVGDERNTLNGGVMVTGYVNKFSPYADGTPRMIDIIPHPYMQEGKILVLSETIPYPMANETRGFVRDVLIPYTYFPLPSQSGGVNKIQYNFSILNSYTVECFNPGPQASITCVDETK
jgi:hypothetical protein